MHMHRFFICWLFLLLPSALLAQVFPSLSFQKFFDHTGEDYARGLLKTQDDHLILGGNSVIDPEEGPDCANLWFLKVDTLGEILWQQEVPLKGCEELRDMVITEDNGLLFTGLTNGHIRHDEKGDRTYWADAFVGKLDAFGRLEWLRNYGGSRFDQGLSLTKGTYDEYLVVGGSHSRDGDLQQNKGMSDLWAFKLDARGNIIYNQSLGGSGAEWAHSVSRCANGDFLIAGFTNSPDFTYPAPLGKLENGLLIRMREGGFIEWVQSFSCPLGGYFHAVQECPDGRILLAGNYRQAQSGRDFWYLRLTADGKPIQDQRISAPADQWWLATDVCADGGYVLGGYSHHQSKEERYAKGGEDFWLLRAGARGEVLWKNTYGGPGDERCVDVITFRPGVFFALGQKRNRFQGGNGTYDYWLVRIDEKACDSIQASIFVRSRENRIDRETPTRFRARCAYGDRFLWDFGDGTTSTEKEPLKSYRLSGLYQVSLTVFANESCQQTVYLPKDLEVW